MARASMRMAAAPRRRRRTPPERSRRWRKCSLRPRGPLESESPEGSGVQRSALALCSDPASLFVGAVGDAVLRLRLLASSPCCDSTSGLRLTGARGLFPAAAAPLLRLSSSAPGSCATGAFSNSSYCICLSCNFDRKTVSLRSCVRFVSAMGPASRQARIAEDKAGALGGETAAEDEQVGEDEGPGWRRWKEWTRRWNLRCPTQERGGRDDDDEEDEEQGKRGVRGRGKKRSRQGDGEEEDEEEVI